MLNLFNFIEHINNIVAEAFRTYGFIYRNCRNFTNTHALSVLFFSLVKTQLEYCSPIWYPICQVHIYNVESVQWAFLNFLCLIIDGSFPTKGCDHCELLNRFSFTSLYVRKILFAIKILYNLLHSKIDYSWLLKKLNFLVPRINSRHSLTFYCLGHRTNISIKSPIAIMCEHFNFIFHLAVTWQVNNVSCITEHTIEYYCNYQLI